jgi:diguanylate cyclase (GGDEF)-like protein
MQIPLFATGAGRHSAIARPAPAIRKVAAAFPLLFLGAHALSITFAGTHAQLFSLIFLILAPLLAGAACLYRARLGGVGDWTALGLAMLLWSGGMAASAVSAFLLPDASAISSLSMLLFVLYGVPVIFAVASPDQEPWHVRLVDGALALVLGYLFFVHTFAFASMSGASDTGVANLRLMFDIENLFIALFALVRFGAGMDPARRTFFRALTEFAFLYLAAAAYINHLQMDTNYGSLIDLVIGLPFLALIWRALQYPYRHADRPHASRWFVKTVRAASPLMLPVTLLAVSGSLVESRLPLAIGGFVVALLGYGLRNVLVQMRSFDVHDRLHHLSRIDPLTGLPNRRQFDESLRREWARAGRAGEGFALLMIDIDHFKLLNDNYGHLFGDERLRDVAGALADCATRGSDIVARYGGEEFAVISPSTDASQGAALAETMRAAVERLNLASPATGGRVTVSVGVGYVEHAGRNEFDAVIEAADAALYDAKRNGRNRVATQNT